PGERVSFTYLISNNSNRPFYIIHRPRLETCGTIAIDVKPGDFPNSINLGSGGTVPVAILSTTTFDARTVDATTVTFAGAPVKFNGQGMPMASFEDVNSDGRLDLVVHITTGALQLSTEDTEAFLVGRTFAGTCISGKDTVRLLP